MRSGNYAVFARLTCGAKIAERSGSVKGRKRERKFNLAKVKEED